MEDKVRAASGARYVLVSRRTLLQTHYWFYDLTAMLDLSDYDSGFKSSNDKTPGIDAPPHAGFAPYDCVSESLGSRISLLLVS